VGAQGKQTAMALFSPGKRPFLYETAFFNIFESDLFHGADSVKTSQRQDLHNYLLNFT
jgi:hypothetical protein